ncbi:hypothetical protein [Streptomyces parvus]|uniref:Lipoprotein n=1 Tax=Streptomyces parvus TaxID=66428 RepID=A0A7K3RYU9_9ACTN|nr:hypothetical protein [Streptomyces parvus]NEC20398.1 hypothetical protein [Streptomyces parvus]
MRRRILTTAVSLTAALLVGGCSGSADTAAPGGAGSKTSPTAGEPAASPASPSSPGSASAPALEYPEKAQALVPETSGAGSKNLPAFTPTEESYTVYADCTGKGSVSLVDRDDPDGEPHPISCDDVPTVGVIHTEAVPQHLMVKVTGGAAQWAIAIVSGDKRPV